MNFLDPIIYEKKILKNKQKIYKPFSEHMDVGYTNVGQVHLMKNNKKHSVNYKPFSYYTQMKFKV